MSVLYDGEPAVDLVPLAAAMGDSWLARLGDRLARANTFAVPVGREPGRGAVLLRRAQLDALDTTSDHVLTFTSDGGTSSDALTADLQSITLLRAECVTPGGEGDPAAVYCCELVDRRWHLARVPVDAAYNLVSPGGTGYLYATTDAGVAWTWGGVLEELWALLDAGTVPSLPFSPDGVPENLSFWGATAWGAVNDVLDRLACTVAYSPVTDTFAFVRLGDTAAALAVAAGRAMAALDAGFARIWDGYHLEPDRGRLPETVRVLFRRRPVPAGGTSPFYAVDVLLSPTAGGVEAGSVEQLKDDMTAVGATGTPTNSAALATRAAERAADWRRKRVGYERRLTLVYRDHRPEAGTLPGGTVARTLLADRGVQVTEAQAGPDGLLEKWDWRDPFAGLWPGPCGSGSGADEGNCLVPVSLVSNVCPVFTTITQGGSGGGTVEVVTGLRVERRTVSVPAAWLPDEPACQENPTDCCNDPVESVDTDCCPDDPVPSRLYAVVEDLGGDCGCVAGTYVIEWNGTPVAEGGYWVASIGDPCDIAGPEGMSVVLTCTGGDWSLEIGPSSGGPIQGTACFTGGTADATCSPFSLVFDPGPENSNNNHAQCGQLCGTTPHLKVTVTATDPGAGGGGGGIITACCPSDGVPSILMVSLSSGGSFFVTYAGNFGGTDLWQGIEPDGGFVQLECSPGAGPDWTFGFASGPHGSDSIGPLPDSATCSPLELVWTDATTAVVYTVTP